MPMRLPVRHDTQMLRHCDLVWHTACLVWCGRRFGMDRFDGTSARQLDLIAPEPPPARPRPQGGSQLRPTFRLLKQDVYAELTRRRRRAQIAARHALDKAEG
jgi:hypothetical protein